MKYLLLLTCSLVVVFLNQFVNSLPVTQKLPKHEESPSQETAETREVICRCVNCKLINTVLIKWKLFYIDNMYLSYGFQTNLEYERYLKEIVNALETDPEFRAKLDKTDEADIRVSSKNFIKAMRGWIVNNIKWPWHALNYIYNC